MKTKCLLVLSLFYSFSSFSAVSLADKRERVEELMELSGAFPVLNVEAYQREISYEEKGLDLETRTDIELNLLVEKVRTQIVNAFEASLSETGNALESKALVLDAIESDLESAGSEYQEELRKLALETLDDLVNGGLQTRNLKLPSIERSIKKQVRERKKFLNEDLIGNSLKMNSLMSNTDYRYDNKKSLLNALVADKNSSKDVGGTSTSINTSIILKTDTRISLQVKMEFLGATLEAGPTISFKREIATNANIKGEGLHPVVTNSGGFDFYKRDKNNNILKVRGVPQARNIIFNCNSQMNFESEYTGGGGFKYMGIGADTSFSTKFKHSVQLSSRSVQLPEVIGNQTTTVKMISDLCHNDFLQTKYNSQMTVYKSLDMMMKNVTSGLIFSHSKTTCVRNSDCNSWFNKQPSLKRKNNVARCVQHKDEKYQFCQIRGKVNQSCPLYSKGKLITSGVNEYPCDWGYKCVQIEPAYYILGLEWSPAIGRCQKK